jgi:hypothetical protein
MRSQQRLAGAVQCTLELQADPLAVVRKAWRTIEYAQYREDVLILVRQFHLARQPIHTLLTILQVVETAPAQA